MIQIKMVCTYQLLDILVVIEQQEFISHGCQADDITYKEGIVSKSRTKTRSRT
jgi:hypothetical protein